MESYPLEYVLHHVPLMAVLGLAPLPSPSTSDPTADLGVQGSSTGALSTAAMKASSRDAVLAAGKASLLAALMAKNSVSVWDAASGKGVGFFHVVSLDRVSLMPRRISFLRENRSFPPANRLGPTTHSSLSPLNPSSPLFPDGIMSPSWVKRHREQVPSAVVSFYSLWDKSADETIVERRDPLIGSDGVTATEREKDQQLCQEINERRRNVQDRGIKFAVVLLLKGNSMETQHLDERVAFIRRTCSLDTKNSLFVLPLITGAANEVTDFINGLQKHLYENAVAYYREHGKRIKKKKSKLPVMPLRPTTVSNLPLSLTAQHSTAPSSSTSPTAKPLHPIGWSVRYEYKMGVFAEFRQDLDNAERHYEGAYQSLVDMFHSSIGNLFAPGGGGGGNGEVLQPFSSRWNEARTLADCISLKICKLSLYTDAPVAALQQLYKHISNFKSVPEHVAIGSESMSLLVPGVRPLAASVGGGSFEYWSWVAKQFRVFGELVQIATAKIGLKVPYPPPGTLQPATSPTPHAPGVPPLSQIPNITSNGFPAGDSASSLFGAFGTSNPWSVVQHAGFYYYMAACCTEERWHRFKIADKEDDSPIQPIAPAAGSMNSRSPPSVSPLASLSKISSTTPLHQQHLKSSLSAERQIDHGTMIIELLTKAYEQFKAHKSGRMTLFLASDIARMYETSGKQEMALKFFERIGKTYRKENWPAILHSILSSIVRCAEVLGRKATAVESLFELLSERITPQREDREALWDKLLGLLSQAPSPPPSGRGWKVTIDADSVNSILEVGVQFRKPNAFVRSPAGFQVTISATSSQTPVRAFRLSKVRVGFSNPRLDQVWLDAGETAWTEALESGKVVSSANKLVQWIDCSGTRREVDPDNSETTVAAGVASPTSGRRMVHVADADLSLLPGVKKVFEGSIVPLESEDLKIALVSLILETGSGTLWMDYRVGDRREDTSKRRRWLGVQDHKPKFVILDGYGEQSTVRVIRRQPNVSISFYHAPPGFLDEVYNVSLHVANEEDESVHGMVDVEFRSTMTDGSDPTSHLTRDRSTLSDSDKPDIASAGEPTAPISIDLGTIAAKSSATIPLFLRAIRVAGERVMYVSFAYRVLHARASSEDDAPAANLPSHSSETAESSEIPPEMQYPFRKSETLRIAFQRAFEGKFETTFRAGSGDAAAGWGGADVVDTEKNTILPSPGEAGLLSEPLYGISLVRREGWMLGVSVRSMGPWDVEVKGVDLNIGSELPKGVSLSVKRVFANPEPSEGVAVWKSGQNVHFMYSLNLVCDVQAATNAISAGSMWLIWRRKSESNTDSSSWVRSFIKLPQLDLTNKGVWAFAKLPGEPEVGKLFTLRFTVQNATLGLVELAASVEPSDGFVFAGYKQSGFRLLPLSSHTLTFNCLPLIAGRCPLPRLKIVKKIPGGTAATPQSQDGKGGDEEFVPIYAKGGCGKDGEMLVFVKPNVQF
ncbi:Gryzun, putative trafficking through golgi-domain-containing protein [Zopfochytrium polystomum]|nr:Gryzun, putative trafficking through golgi-domain-containing protein [Zopfochytrium polystomum]